MYVDKWITISWRNDSYSELAHSKADAVQIKRNVHYYRYVKFVQGIGSMPIQDSLAGGKVTYPASLWHH